MTTDETHTTPESKGKEPLYTSNGDSANEEHDTPTVNADRDVDGVVEGLNALTVTEQAIPACTSRGTHVLNYLKSMSAYHAPGKVTSDDESANEEHDTPTVNADRDVDGVVEGLKPLTVTKKATPAKTSSETYLLNYAQGIKAGLDAYGARGAVGTNQYIMLMKLRKYKECPYGSHQPELRKAWFHFVKNFPPMPKSDEYYLEAFGKAYTKNPDLHKARGIPGLYKFCALKKIVDEDLKFSGELEAYEHLLKRVWTYEAKLFTERSYLTHLVDFHESYEKDGDFMTACGKWNSARYKALCILDKVTDLSTYEEPYQSMIRKLQEGWKTNMTWKEHLKDFYESYQKDDDFKKARGDSSGARYKVLSKLTNVTDLSEYEEPYRSMIVKLQEVWETNMTWKEHLEAFRESYQKDSDFKKARGTHTSARYHTLNKLTKVTDLSTYDEPHRSIIRKLQEVWAGQKTWEEHLVDFHESYQEDSDFKKARGDSNGSNVARYKTLSKLTKVQDLSTYEEPYRSMISFLQEVWQPIKLPVSQKHLTAFFESYENGGNFDEARGKSDSARYHILKNLNEDNAYTYDEPHQSLILKLQKVWKEHEHL